MEMITSKKFKSVNGIIGIFSFLFFTCATNQVVTKPTQPPKTVKNLKKQIELVLKDSVLQQSKVGIKIVSLKNGEVLYSRNSDKLFHPASNMKLLTTATALHYLGPSFTFKTILAADTASLSDSLLQGNLYLKGFGDPELTTADLRNFVQKLKLMGINKITGDLLCDATYFDDLHWGEGWMWDDASSWYFASISPLSVNDNIVTVFVEPGKNVADSLEVHLVPPTSYVKIQNMGATVDSTDTLKLKEFDVERKWKFPENTIVVEGGMHVGEKQEDFEIDVLKPALYTGTLLKEQLKEQNIAVNGNVKEGELPDTIQILINHQSHPLSQLVFNTNKISDNLSAELILKTLAAEIKAPPGSAEKGISIIYQFLDSLGVDSTSYRLADGSGVSRYNLITPDLIIELLKAMHQDFNIQAEFKASLPIAARDGTLKNRMEETSAAERLRAKTGSLSGVSALSGYTVTADHEVVAFSMIMEQFVKSASEIRDVQDKIGNLISSFSRQ